MEAAVERVAFRRWRGLLWRAVDGERILEVGVGTGKNLPHHPPGAQVTAIDLSERMLEQAAGRGPTSPARLELALMDGERLGFPDASFDAAVATFVFCSVPDPVHGLQEVGRVVRSGGRVVLPEHVRVNTPVIGPLMDLLDPVVLRLMGPHINRRTVGNVESAGLEIERVEELAPGGLVKLIVASSS